MKTSAKKVAVVIFAGIILVSVVPLMAKPMPATIAVALTEKPSEMSVIEGVVKDQVTGKRLQNVYICVEGCTKGAMTNSSGKFILKEVPVGCCKVKVVKTGYETMTNEITLVKGKTLKVKIEMKQSA